MSKLANETQNNTTATPAAEEKKKKTIDVIELLKFEANTEVAFVNTIEATEIINNLFGNVLRDYCGSKICLNDGTNPTLNSIVPVGKFYVNLYFRMNDTDTSDAIPNLVSRAASVNGKSRYDILRNMTGLSAGRAYEFTPETFEALNEFRFAPERPFNWNNVTTELTSQYGFPGSYNQEIIACINGLDFEKILNKVYGTRTEEGIFQYQAVPVQFVANASGEFVMQITRLDVRKLEDLRRSLGGGVTRTEFHSFIR